MTDDVRKLLGGYATGTLTEDEQKALFEAALHDDALFAALADEHALKDLLEDSAVRAQLLQATEEPRFSVIGALSEWFERPKSKALVATGAVLLAIIGFNQVRETQEPRTATVAEMRRPAAPPEPTTPPETPTTTPRKGPASPVAPRRESPPQSRLADAQSGAALETAKRDEPPTVRQAEQKQEVPVQAATAPPPPPAAAPAAAAPAEKAMSAAPRVSSIRSADSSRTGNAGQLSGTGVVGAFQRAAGTSITPLRYELLRKDAAGNFQAIPTDYLFTPGDMIRLRVTSTRNGAVGVSSNAGNETVSQALLANAWTEVPQTGGIPITTETTKLTVAFAPSDTLTSNLMETDEARAKRAGTPSVTLEIPIRQKKP